MEVYDKRAAEFLERAYRTPEIVNQRLRTLAALGLAAGEAVLDAGCGTGLLLELEAAAVGKDGRAEGIDLSDDMLATARERCGDLPQVNLSQGTVEALPFADASFAAASCTQTLLYVDDLDAGCGTGLLLELEAAAVGKDGRAEGIDLSDDMLATARERCGDLPQVNLSQGSVEALPFADASFDAASCTQTLLYVDDLDAALAELHRVLRPRGRLAIVETDWTGTIVSSHDQALTRRIFDAWGDGVANPNLPRRLKPLLEGAGFGGVRVEPVPIVNLGSLEGGFSAGMLKNFADGARKHGTIDEAEAKAWRDGIAQLSARGEYFFCVNRFLFSAIK